MTKSSISITIFIITRSKWTFNPYLKIPYTTRPIININGATIPITIIGIRPRYSGCTYSDRRTITRGCDTIPKLTVTLTVCIRGWSYSGADSLPSIIYEQRIWYSVRILTTICGNFIRKLCRCDGCRRIFTPYIHIYTSRTIISIWRANNRRGCCTRTYSTQGFSIIEHHYRFTG